MGYYQCSVQETNQDMLCHVTDGVRAAHHVLENP
jgi:hypothetical protein